MTSRAVSTILEANLRALVSHAMGHAPPTPAFVLFDRRSPLAQRLEGGYREALPHAAFVDFDLAAEDCLMPAFDALPRGSLVVLIQSTRFTLGAFRFRLELFRRGLAVVEHPHLARVKGGEIDTYADALAYDPAYYRTLGPRLKAQIDAASQIRLVSSLGALHYVGPFENAKLNIGDYTGMATVGGQFPIGEVFTELRDLTRVSGVAAISAFGADDFSVHFAEAPFTMIVDHGSVTAAPGAPPAFHALLETIAKEEGQVWVRELGFGINRALTPASRVNDVSIYERMCGMHMSLGAKHAVYAKAGFTKRKNRFHVDVFASTDRVLVDDTVVYQDGAYLG